MNKLYSILTYKVGTIGGTDDFGKAREPVGLSDKSKTLVDYLMDYKTDGAISDTDRTRLACLICWAVRYTPFGVEISERDPSNTYTDVIKYASTGSVLPLYNLIRPEGTQNMLLHSLDDDIRDKLYVPTWLELAGGISLQLLRETYV